MDGGENEKTVISGSFASSLFRCALTAGYFSSAFLRSSQGFKGHEEKKVL